MYDFLYRQLYIALNCLVFEKIAFFLILATDRQTTEQMDSTDALSRSRCRERRLCFFFVPSLLLAFKVAAATEITRSDVTHLIEKQFSSYGRKHRTSISLDLSAKLSG